MQKTQPKISEILHLAADKYLWDGDWYSDKGGSTTYSCLAVVFAYYHFNPSDSYYQDIFDGLKNMGLHTNSSSEFDEFPEGEERQVARYVWLKFAAMIAEEQGL